MVRLFGFTVWIEDDSYEGHIPARTWAEAEAMVAAIGGEVNGEVPDDPVICDMCGDALRADVEPRAEIFFWLDGGNTGH